MIRFARNVTNSVKSHTPQLKALHSSKITSPQLSTSGIRSVTRNLALTKKIAPIFLQFQKIEPRGSPLTKTVKVGFAVLS